MHHFKGHKGPRLVWAFVFLTLSLCSCTMVSALATSKAAPSSYAFGAHKLLAASAGAASRSNNGKLSVSFHDSALGQQRTQILEHPGTTKARGRANGLRVAVVNSVGYHLEVLAGFLHALHRHTPHVRLYVHNYTLPGNKENAGFFHYMQWRGSIESLPQPPSAAEHADLVIFISPEYHLKDYVAPFINASKPQAVLLMLHNADKVLNGSDCLAAQQLARLHRNAYVLALSPHVVHYTQEHAGVTPAWWLAVHRYPNLPMPPLHVTVRGALVPPVTAALSSADASSGIRMAGSSVAAGGSSRRPTTGSSSSTSIPRVPVSQPCIAEGNLVPDCLKGFTLQGKITSARRDYSGLWRQLVSLPKSARSGLDLIVLGQTTKSDAKNFEKLIPKSIRAKVKLQRNLQYTAYYDTIQRSLALLTLFASKDYTTTKLSSTVITSLITGTPVLLHRNASRAYTFLDDDSAYFQEHNETTVQAMARILKAGPGTWLRVRHGLARVAALLNARASDGLQDLLDRLAAGHMEDGAVVAPQQLALFSSLNTLAGLQDLQLVTTNTNTTNASSSVAD